MVSFRPVGGGRALDGADATGLLGGLDMGLVGAVNALAGVGLAGWLESRRDASRHKYENEVSSHDQRLIACALGDKKCSS